MTEAPSNRNDNSILMNSPNERNSVNTTATPSLSNSPGNENRPPSAGSDLISRINASGSDDGSDLSAFKTRARNIGSHRRSSQIILPEPNRIFTEETQFTQEKDVEIPLSVLRKFFNISDSNSDSLARISNDIKEKLQDELIVNLEKLSSEIQNTSQYATKVKIELAQLQEISNLSFEHNREIAILPILKTHYLIKQSKSLSQQYQGNIRRIAQAQDFCDENATRITNFDFDGFRDECIGNKVLHNYDFFIKSLTSRIENSKLEDYHGWDKALYNPKTRSGKIFKRFKERLLEMDYSDLEVIVNAIILKPEAQPLTRRIFFSYAWTQILFPFSDIQPMILPKLENLSAKSFNAPFIPEKYLTVPLNKLSNTDWPYKDVCDMLFIVLVELDPFLIADMFWNLIQQTAREAQKINPEITDLDFDQLFSLLVVIVLAFGVDEILETLAFSASFEEYVDANVQQKFAMEYMASLVKYLNDYRANQKN